MTFSWQDWIERTSRPSRPLTPELMPFWRCPECDGGVAVGPRAAGRLSVRCSGHGTWVADPPFVFGTGPPVLERDAGAGSMNPEDRLWQLDRAATTLLAGPRDGYMIIDVMRVGCEYLIVERCSDGVRLELCSREWDCGHCANAPLSAGATRALDTMGFARGGYRWNPSMVVDGHDARTLAMLCELALAAGYELAPDFETTVYFRDAANTARLLDALSGPARTPIGRTA